MTAVADFRCSGCGRVVELPLTAQHAFWCACEHVSADWVREWGPVSVGRGSSGGTPPRG